MGQVTPPALPVLTDVLSDFRENEIVPCCLCNEEKSRDGFPVTKPAKRAQNDERQENVEDARIRNHRYADAHLFWAKVVNEELPSTLWAAIVSDLVEPGEETIPAIDM
jgi:hypothetical protein